MNSRSAELDMEKLNDLLHDPKEFDAYQQSHANYRPSIIPRLLGSLLVFGGNLVYGRKPSYLKFRAVEVIARVPYHAWESVIYLFLTWFYTDEARALRYAHLSEFSRTAQDNETMHVVVVSQLAKHEKQGGFVRETVIPMISAFFYYWSSCILYFFEPRWSFELNYVFEVHAFEQYSWFLKLYEDELKKKSIDSDFLRWYGRAPKNQYEFFTSVRNDELIHRNRSVEAIKELT